MSRAQKIAIKQAWIHPKFSLEDHSTTRPYDIAILILADPIKSEAFQSGFAALAVLGDMDDHRIQDLYLLGWGACRSNLLV